MTGPGTARQREQIGALRHAARRAALHGAGADFGHADMGEDRTEGVDFFLVDVAVRLDRDIAAGQAGAAGGDDDIDISG